MNLQLFFWTTSKLKHATDSVHPGLARQLKQVCSSWSLWISRTGFAWDHCNQACLVLLCVRLVMSHDAEMWSWCCHSAGNIPDKSNTKISKVGIQVWTYLAAYSWMCYLCFLFLKHVDLDWDSSSVIIQQNFLFLQQSVHSSLILI